MGRYQANSRLTPGRSDRKTHPSPDGARSLGSVQPFPAVLRPLGATHWGIVLLERARAAATAARPAETKHWLYSLAGVIAAVSLYSAFHIAARLIASGNLGEDDPYEAVLTQTLQLGYVPRQPPLYDWMLWLLQQATGPGALSFQLLKYGLLTATCAFIFAAARRAMKGEAFWAFLSVEALALIYQISWRFHEGFTHAVGAMFAVAATLWALLRLIERRSGADYALFGVMAGLGLLTVMPFWVYLGALIGAAAIQPASRRVIVQPAFCASLVLALSIASPYLLWLAQTPEGIGAILPTVQIGSDGYWREAVEGVRRSITEPVLYLAPLIFLYPIFFPGFLGTLRRTVRLTPEQDAPADAEQLILHLTLLNIAALLIGAVIFGIGHYPTHALMPLFLVTSIWLTAQARKAARTEGEVRRFVTLAVSIAIFAFVARCANMYVLEPVCQICRWGIPYGELAEAVKARGFERGRLVVYDEELAGNLRRFFPQARILLAAPRPYLPPERPAAPGDKTALIWGSRRTERVARAFDKILPNAAEAMAHAETLSLPWRGHLWRPDGHRVSQWRLVILEQP